jgi:hypothetical protein
MAHELTDWYEEAERLRVERDALTARLADLRDIVIAAQLYIHDPCPSNLSDLAALVDTYERACATLPAPPTAAPLAAAEREAARRLGEVSERMYQNCTIDTSGGCDALSAVAPSDWGEWVDALDGWTIARDASRAARGEASDA